LLLKDVVNKELSSLIFSGLIDFIDFIVFIFFKTSFVLYLFSRLLSSPLDELLTSKELLCSLSDSLKGLSKALTKLLLFFLDDDLIADLAPPTSLMISMI
jgi:hypothetical protein